MRIGDDLSVIATGIASLSLEEVQKRLRYLADADLSMFADTRNASDEEYDAIERRQRRSQSIQQMLRARQRHLRGIASGASL